MSSSTLTIDPQPDETTCGPTALHALYRYYGDDISLQDVIAEVTALEGGGTFGARLAHHALKRGYEATLYTYNLQVFDPTWFHDDRIRLRDRLLQQLEFKKNDKLRLATEAYVEFLDAGGQLRLEDLSSQLLLRHLEVGEPILVGLSATYLYHSAREHGPTNKYDDLRGEPMGHFVVLSGYDAQKGRFRIADPMSPNPIGVRHHYYEVSLERLLGAIFLGVLTYDGNLLVLRPAQR